MIRPEETPIHPTHATTVASCICTIITHISGEVLPINTQQERIKHDAVMHASNMQVRVWSALHTLSAWRVKAPLPCSQPSSCSVMWSALCPCRHQTPFLQRIHLHHKMDSTESLSMLWYTTLDVGNSGPMQEDARRTSFTHLFCCALGDIAASAADMRELPALLRLFPCPATENN